MIATPTWINANSAMEYHTESKDNYYKKEGDLGEWHGKGAEALGFVGKITEKELEKALWGKNNDDKQVVGARLDKNGDRKRAALDLTFNAPKSVSLAMELAGASGNQELAKAIISAHDKAVSKGIDKFEKLIQTRETIDGNTSKYRSGNIAVAKFTHSVARPVTDEKGKTTVDPSLHTHAVVMNVTKAKDGSFKAIETGDIYKEYIKVGAQYRMELAHELKDLGFDIRITNQSQAFFEVGLKTNDDDRLLDEFSKRSHQLNNENLISELKSKYPKKSDSEIKQMAAYHSREWKGEINREEIQKENLSRAEALGFDKNKSLTTEKTLDQKNENKEDLAHRYIDNAIYALSEEKSVFTDNDIVTMAGKMAMQDDIAPSFIDGMLEENKSLISLGDDNYTTKDILKAEHDLIDAVKDTKKLKQPYFKKEAKELVKNYSSDKKDKTGFALTKGQQEAATHILSSKNQVIGIQGDAGVGKTTMLKAVNELKSKDTKIIGLSYTGKAANEIELKTAIKSKEIFKAAGIESSTVSSFLNKYEKGYLELGNEKNLKIIVDEASMLGTKDAANLAKIVKDTNAQLVLIGDEKQFKSINAGDPFTLLKNHAGMKTVDMNEVLRQKDRTLKSAVWALNQYDSKKAFDILDKKGLIQETDKGVSEVVREYFRDDEKDKLAVVGGKESYKDNIILTNTNKTKDEINEEIRERHQFEGNIDKEEHSFIIKKSVSLTPSEKFLAENYAEKKGENGKIIRERATKVFLQGNIGGELKAGQEFEITDINEKKNTLTLDGKYEVDLKSFGKYLQAYQEKNINLSENEKIIFTKNDKKLGINNGESAILRSINEDGNAKFFIGEKKKEVSFNIKNDYNYIDYGYAITTMKSQGQTAKNVIAYMKGEHQNFNSFYVAATRAEESLKIFTDDKKKLSDFIEVEQVKYNATSLWEQLDKKEKDRIERYQNKNQTLQNAPTNNQEKVLKNAPTKQENSKNQIDFAHKIADTLYLDINENMDNKDAKSFINENIEDYKQAMDDRHDFLLHIDPDELNLENQEKYYEDLIEKISDEKDFEKSLDLIQKYNEHNEISMFEKEIQIDKLVEVLNIRGMDVANRVLENNFESEYIGAFGLRDKPYEIATHVNNVGEKMRYEDEKVIAKLDLVFEKSDKYLFEKTNELLEKGADINDEKVQEMLGKAGENTAYFGELRDEMEGYFDKKYLTKEFEEEIKNGNIYGASKLLGENKGIFEEEEVKYMEEVLDYKMNEAINEKEEEILKEIETLEKWEQKEMEDNENLNISEDKDIEKGVENENEEERGREEYENER